MCVEIAGIIAGGAEQRKLELWMSAALLGASHFTLSENERQQAIARVQGAVRGYHCNWQFAIAQVEIYFDGECDNVGPFICTAFGPEFYSRAFLLLAFLARAGIDWRIGLVDDIAGCRTLKHCSASQLPPPLPFTTLLYSTLSCESLKFIRLHMRHADSGERTTDEGHRFGFGFGFPARTRF